MQDLTGPLITQLICIWHRPNCHVLRHKTSPYQDALLIHSSLFILVRYIYSGITSLFWHLGQHRKANRNTLLADATADTETRKRANTLTFAHY